MRPVPLDEYRRKRDFAATPEPAGREAPAHEGGARFVVHKHAARALHYDLRLEIGGVYASWAVPKGPSLDTADKHLAVHVEDHPLEYGEFEGTIPAGEYGAGTVMIWDRGRFMPMGDAAAGVEGGQLKFVLEGSKLSGGFALVRMRPRPGEKRENWLLIKERDDHVRPRSAYDVLAALPDSAATGRTMEEIAASGAVWDSGGVEGGPAKDPAPARVAPARGGDGGGQPMPRDAPFQLATLADAAPDGDEWISEVKYDGYRLRVALEGGRARVTTRNGADWTERFPGLSAAAAALPVSAAVLDGEAVVLDADGRSDFGLLQEALADGGSPAAVTFAAFDVLFLDGHDLRGETLLRRKEVLRALFPGETGVLRYVDHVAGDARAFHEQACGLGLEGSIAKRADRPWVPGRSRDWLKVKCAARQEFVVVGWTDPAGSRSGFGALLLAVNGSDGLRYAGRVGTGFTAAVLADLRARLDKLATDAPPVVDPPRARGLHWVRPKLVAEVRFREWTRDGVVRQPSFRGLREDKDPATVTREAPAPAADPPAADPPAAAKADVTVAGVRITNPGKVLDPAGIAKGDLARYYGEVAPAMLPHLEGRLLTIVRCPHGPGGGAGCFYQKHPESRGWPASLGVTPVRERDGSTQPYFHADSAEALVALAQMGSLEIHTWGSRADDPEHPDRIIFDLDPGDGVSFEGVARAARTVRDALGALELPAFVKTTGGHGLHVVVPVRPEHDWDTVRAAAHAFVERLAAADPASFTSKMAKSVRPGRVFVDYLRNAHGATAVCAFSTRARPGAPVSVPVGWDELDGLDPLAFDTAAVLARLRRASDPWRDYERDRARLTADVLAALGSPAP